MDKRQEHREVVLTAYPQMYDCEAFYLYYNTQTDKVTIGLNPNVPANEMTDDIIIIWDGKDSKYQLAHSKKFIDAYKSNSDVPEKGYRLVMKNECESLCYYYERIW